MTRTYVSKSPARGLARGAASHDTEPQDTKDGLHGVTTTNRDQTITIVPDKSIEPSSDVLGFEDALNDVRTAERELDGTYSLSRYIRFAEAILRLKVQLKNRGLRLKKTMEESGLNYQLGQQAIAVRETTEKYPALRDLGPSKVLLVREAERRFAREGCPDRVGAVIEDLAAGKPRSTVRKEHLPQQIGPQPKEPGSRAAQVLELLRDGRIEPARRAYEQCADGELRQLRAIGRGLVALVGQGLSVDGAPLPGQDTPAPTGASDLEAEGRHE